jgi:hypothetical protein
VTQIINGVKQIIALAKNKVGRHLDPSGDFYILENSIVGSGADWKIVCGTKEFKEITVAGKEIEKWPGLLKRSITWGRPNI